MSNLETAAKPIITAIRDGSMPTITPSSQEILALWAAKTAITGSYSSSDASVPLRRRTWIFKNQQCPPDTRVWLARYVGERQATFHSTFHFFTEAKGKPLSMADGQIVFITAGEVMLIVSAFNFKDVLPTVNFPPELKKHLFQIWPPTSEAINWLSVWVDDAIRTKFGGKDFADSLEIIVQFPTSPPG